MLEHIVGRPSLGLKRAQIVLVLTFWIWRLIRGGPNGPGIFSKFNVYLKRFTPWQIILSTLSIMYASRNIDCIIGLADFYRATWIVTALDAAFASCIPIRPKFLRDLMSILFTGYYLVFAGDADEKLRRFRAVCSVEMFRATWEKTSNPYLRVIGYFDRPRLPVVQTLHIPRPASSKHSIPIKIKLFFSRTERELAWMNELVLDLPGGGFVCMSPEHHEERLRNWCVRIGRPVVSVNYGKAPEYPYPWAIEECFDAYKVLMETKGSVIGMSGRSLRIILSGDSAGGNLVATTMFKILEYNNPTLGRTFIVPPTPSIPSSAPTPATPSTVQNPSTNPSSTSPIMTNSRSRSPSTPLPLPIALVLAYPALDFNFTSWMTPSNLRSLFDEEESVERCWGCGCWSGKGHGGKRGKRDGGSVKERRVRRQRSWAGRLLSVGGGGEPISPVTKKGGKGLFGWDGDGHRGNGNESADLERGSLVAPKEVPSVTSETPNAVAAAVVVKQNGGDHVAMPASGTGTGTGTAATFAPAGVTRQVGTGKGVSASFRARVLSRVSEVNDLAIDTNVTGNSTPARVNGAGPQAGRSSPPRQMQVGGGGGPWENVFSSGEDEDEGGSSHTLPSPAKKDTSLSATEGVIEEEDDGGNESDDEEDEEDEEDDWHVRYGRMEDKDKPLSARVLYSDGDDEKGKEKERSGKKEAKMNKVPIGTRVTMTSRAAFFTDRIISPAMMRAMAILYVGPKHNPDFMTDYYISPIFAPSHLLSHFPPVLMICGERDPFVDDTIIFGGKIREAKRMRKTELRAGVGGESLRLSSMNPSAKERERERLLNEKESDWVDMRLVEGWGHGFLQMTALLPRAKLLINEMADWMGDRFATSSSASASGSALSTVPGRAIRAGFTHKRPGSPRRPEFSRRASTGSGGGDGTPALVNGDGNTSFKGAQPIFPLPSASPVIGTSSPPSGVSPTARMVPMNRIISEELSSTSAQSTETERDAPLSFTPRKNRSPPPPPSQTSFGVGSNAVDLITSPSGASPQLRRTAMPVKPDASVASVGELPSARPSNSATPTLLNPGANRTSQSPVENASEMLKQTVSPSRQPPIIIPPLLGPSMPNSTMGGATTGAVLLSEAELIRRRRAQAVFGMGEMMTASAVQERELNSEAADNDGRSDGLVGGGTGKKACAGGATSNNFDGMANSINANALLSWNQQSHTPARGRQGGCASPHFVLPSHCDPIAPFLKTEVPSHDLQSLLSQSMSTTPLASMSFERGSNGNTDGDNNPPRSTSPASTSSLNTRIRASAYSATLPPQNPPPNLAPQPSTSQAPELYHPPHHNIMRNPTAGPAGYFGQQLPVILHDYPTPHHQSNARGSGKDEEEDVEEDDDVRKTLQDILPGEDAPDSDRDEEKRRRSMAYPAHMGPSYPFNPHLNGSAGSARSPPHMNHATSSRSPPPAPPPQAPLPATYFPSNSAELNAAWATKAAWMGPLPPSNGPPTKRKRGLSPGGRHARRSPPLESIKLRVMDQGTSSFTDITLDENGNAIHQTTVVKDIDAPLRSRSLGEDHSEVASENGAEVGGADRGSPSGSQSGDATGPGGTRLPPIMQVEKHVVTTTATQQASASRRRNDALFKCPVPGCGSTFTRRFNLRGHLRSHTEERPFVCEWPGCGKSFARKHDCNRHQSLHSAQGAQHTCGGCGKSFSRTDALNRHLRSEGGAACKRAAAAAQRNNGGGSGTEARGSSTAAAAVAAAAAAAAAVAAVAGHALVPINPHPDEHVPPPPPPPNGLIIDHEFPSQGTPPAPPV
ncbi:uncharacterized protein EI90DRAFT_3016550 [Cantharellus anzutake]|uniref:uncharacterized protein n=1 Tax=Cantharellus anzutake TaxID=1750568 RepID=UPI001904BFBD|nr:uncharacterized protein EI90DRAFT_3016550 [Cantharellus anzutake]KAF8331118.1 hypothetical protein EI90DRAFT_3016550 [Cantharellus anzutake]